MAGDVGCTWPRVAVTDPVLWNDGSVYQMRRIIVV
jgi:hypothetical protein